MAFGVSFNCATKKEKSIYCIVGWHLGGAQYKTHTHIMNGILNEYSKLVRRLSVRVNKLRKDEHDASIFDCFCLKLPPRLALNNKKKRERKKINDDDGNDNDDNGNHTNKYVKKPCAQPSFNLLENFIGFSFSLHFSLRFIFILQTTQKTRTALLVQKPL